MKLSVNDLLMSGRYWRCYSVLWYDEK